MACFLAHWPYFGQPHPNVTATRRLYATSAFEDQFVNYIGCPEPCVILAALSRALYCLRWARALKRGLDAVERVVDPRRAAARHRPVCWAVCCWCCWTGGWMTGRLRSQLDRGWRGVWDGRATLMWAVNTLDPTLQGNQIQFVNCSHARQKR